MEKISWSPKIRQLDHNDGLGAVDVGLGLLDRCRSIWLVTRRDVELGTKNYFDTISTNLSSQFQAFHARLNHSAAMVPK